MNALALVIGNANYSLEKDRLINAVNDADDIAKKLLNLGFTVSKAINCSRESFDREIRKFGEDLKKYDIGLFYFSGHGLQIKGQNYLTAGDENHVLNGILFEIYFNSKGQFRQHNFKCSLIDEIFSLESNERYKNAFEFIMNQIAPFEDFIFYLPSYPPTTLPIELIFEEEKYQVGEKEKTAHKLISIKLHNNEIMIPYAGDDFDSISVSYDQFVEKLQKELCIPAKRLRLSMNVKQEDLKRIYMPWDLKLSKNISKTTANST